MATRAVAKSVTITHGLLSMTGELQTVRVTADTRDGGANTRFTSCCPTDAANQTAVKLDTRYVCPNHPGQLFEAAQVAKAATVDGELKLVGSSADVAAARAATPEDDKKSLELHPHLASELARHTVMGATCHVFRPAGRSPAYALLTELIGQDGRITCEDGQERLLIGVITLKTPKLVMLRTWGDELVLQEIEFPENLRSFEPIERAIDPQHDKLLATVRTLVQESSQPFDPTSYTNTAKASLGAFVQARLADPTAVAVTAPAPAAASGGEDLMAALEASIAAAKALREPVTKPKRTATKKTATVTPIRKAG